MIPLFRNSISTSTSNTPIFPPSLASAVAFDFDAKYNAGFNLRNDLGVDYVVDYTCPVSGIIVSQNVASGQPIKQANTCIFDGIDDFLQYASSPTVREVWAVCQTSKTVFVNYESPFVGYSFPSPSPLLSLFGENNATTQIYTGPTDVGLDNRINNILSNDFAPMSQIKSWSAKQNANNNNRIFIGGQFGWFWQGEIRRLLLFNRQLTSTERADLQNYLQSYHNFTP